MELQLYDFQRVALKQLEPPRHIVVANMGAGKTAIALHWLKRTGKRKWLFVTTASKRDSGDVPKEAATWFGEAMNSVTLEVISWAKLAKWTMSKWDNLEDYAFVFDECLPYDTLVETEDGPRQLGKLTVGDKVWSYNEQTDKLELKPITRTIKKPAQLKMYRIRAGKHEIISTATHPHYTQRGWVEARNIKEGDTVYEVYDLRSSESERKRPEENQEIRGVRVESVEILELTDIKGCGLYCDPGHVYCIDVEDNHNFFANGILTHNCQRAKAGVSSAQGRAFISICKRTDVWTGYTGTPGDRWIDFQAYLVAGGYVKNKTDFIREFCQVQTFKGYPEIVGYHQEDLLERWWREMTVCPDTRKMEAELPAESHYTITFQPSADYKKVAKTRTRLDGEFLDTTGAYCAELRRLAFTKQKQQWLADYLDGLGKPAVLFYALTETGDLAEQIARRALPKSAKVWRVCGKTHDIPSAETVGPRDVVLCQWVAGSEGLNLQFIDEWVSLQPCYSYSTSKQARGRIRRIGQNKPQRFVYLKTEGTIETAIYKCLKDKGTFSESVWFEKGEQVNQEEGRT